MRIWHRTQKDPYSRSWLVKIIRDPDLNVDIATLKKMLPVELLNYIKIRKSLGKAVQLFDTLYLR
jgi:hypothetical protein